MTLEQMQTDGREKMRFNINMLPSDTAVNEANSDLDQHTANTWKAAQESAGKRYITLMNQAIGNTELPEEVWKKIAKVNQIVLDNHSEPKTDFMVEMKVKEFDEVCKRMEADGITKTVNHILECGLLEEITPLTGGQDRNKEADGHNIAVKAIREFITNMK